MVSFNNTSTNATSYNWDFGDGNSSTDSNPSHTYNSDGSYTVVLTATNNCGSVTSSETVTIMTMPTAGFSSNVANGCAPLTVQFSNQSSQNTVSWNWTFPGGNPSSSTDPNPTVIYNSAGTFNVILEVTNATGATNMIEQSNYIVVNDVPTANFTSSINGQSISFSNTTTNANSYSWDFGDGNTSTDFEPSHTYNADGTYTVAMTATNDCGTVAMIETVTITTAPTAAFGSNVTNGCAPLTVQFSNQSSQNTVSWNWTFPGGNPSSSTDPNPTVVYNSAGTFNVLLEVTNATGVTSMVEQSNYIVIDDVPTANFNSAINNYDVDFTNASINATSFSWDFGDGNSSTDSDPSHTYAMDGTYEVVLTATNAVSYTHLTLPTTPYV